MRSWRIRLDSRLNGMRRSVFFRIERYKGRLASTVRLIIPRTLSHGSSSRARRRASFLAPRFEFSREWSA